MRANAGLWIDHREAVIVTISEAGCETRHVRSGVERQLRRSGDPPNGAFDQGTPADDSQEREFTGHLARYYDEVISHVRDAESILILGPGEAKGELKARLEKRKERMPAVEMETADKMTEPQIVARVRHHFQPEATQAVPAGVI